MTDYPQGPGELWLYGDSCADEQLMVMTLADLTMSDDAHERSVWRCTIVGTNARSRRWTADRRNRFLFDWTRDGSYMTLFSRP